MPFNYSYNGIRLVTPYEHPFDKILVRLFCQFAAHYMTYGNPLTSGQMYEKFKWKKPSYYSMFSKLRYWGVVKKVKNAKTGKDTNLYRLTSLGEKFYLGEATVPSYVVTIGGEVIGEGHDAWSMHYGDMPEDKLITELDMNWKSHYEWTEERKLSVCSPMRI